LRTIARDRRVSLAGVAAPRRDGRLRGSDSSDRTPGSVRAQPV